MHKIEPMTQSYKSRTDYCTVFSLQWNVPDLRIRIQGSYRFEFQKIKKYQSAKILNFIQICVYRAVFNRKYRYRPVFGGTDRYLTGIISNINVYPFLAGTVRYL